MPITFVKLAQGNISIDSIREIVKEFKNSNWKLTKWSPQAALVEKKGGAMHLYIGQNFDNKYFDLNPQGWTHDHCLICSTRITDIPDGGENLAYSDGSEWLCKSCYKDFFLPENLDLKLDSLEKFTE